MIDPHAEPELVQDHILSNELYNSLKFVALVVLPALGTLYFTLSNIWNFPLAEELVGTLAAIDTFLGVVLHISTESYNKSDAKYDGSIDVIHLGDKKTFTLNLDKEPGEIEKASEITFKVNPPTF